MASIQRNLRVVLLAGGPGGTAARDILQATAESHVESKVAHRRQLLRGCSGSEYVPLGLTGVCGMPVLESWLTALKYCQRLHAGSSCTNSPAVYVVCNETDVQETKKLVESLTLIEGLHFSIISNGCSDPARRWKGEAADLAAAAAVMKAAAGDPPCHILAISCSLLLFLEHNVSRLIEHALLRSTSGDVCFYSCLSSTDIQIDCKSNANCTYGRVLPAEQVPAPPLHSIEIVPASSCMPGDEVAEPMLLMSSSSLGCLHDYLSEAMLLEANRVADLVGLAAAIAGAGSGSSGGGGCRMHGVDIGAPARLRVNSLLWLEYADTAMYGRYKTLDRALHDERAAVANTGGKASRGALPDPKAAVATGSTINGSQAGMLTSKAAAAALAKHVDLNSVSSELFFKITAAVNAAGIQQPYYHLPPSFFSSAYARAAETAAGATLTAAKAQLDSRVQ